MSGHQFAPGRDGRCARCGCTEAEAVHGGMNGAGELPATTESDSAGHVYQLRDGRAAGLPNPARDIYPVYPPWVKPDAAERLRRLDQLDELERDLLLAFLDGRVPQFVDEWLAGRKPALPDANPNSVVSCTKAKIQLDE